MINLTISLAGATPTPRNGSTHFSAAALFPIDPSPNPWKKAIGKLYAMFTLGDDWDGDGSPAPARPILVSAIELARTLHAPGFPPPTRVVATPSGTIGLEWQRPGAYMEAEVVTAYRSDWMRIADGRPPEHWVVSGGPLLLGPEGPDDAPSVGGDLARRGPTTAGEPGFVSSTIQGWDGVRVNVAPAYWTSTSTPMI